MVEGDIYRACASILVFRSVEGGYEVLLLHKPRKRDAWQLPQGGVEEGETSEQAAVRELKEEAGIDTQVIGESKKVYQYDFPASYRRFRPDNVCGQRITFVFSVSEADVSVQVDGVEVDDYLWVQPQDLGKHMRRRAYLQMVQRLVEEGIQQLTVNN